MTKAGKPHSKEEVTPAAEAEAARPPALATAVPTTTVPAPVPSSVRIDALGDLKRTHTCGELSGMDGGRNTVLMGWVHRVRDHGGVLFIDLRDRYGVTQVVARPGETPAAALERLREVGTEWVLAVSGKVAQRPVEAVNRALPTGEIEVAVLDVLVLSTSDTPPFSVSEEGPEASEDLRLKYRFLDLRRERMQKNLAVRHRLALATRQYLSQQDFLEIETPMLVKPTPEGARDYVVPSRVHPGKFYALPQSPQLYKQTLMASGFDRYFQLARALRDEDLRADRQPEHTQIDIEMSFVRENDVFTLVEGLMTHLWREALKVEVQTPFPRLTYQEAMLRFGSDKPDLRFGLELKDVTAIAGESRARFLQDAAKTEGHKIMALAAVGRANLSRKDLDGLEDMAKRAGVAGLSWMKRAESGWDGGAARFFAGEAGEKLAQHLQAQNGDVAFLTAGPWETACKGLGAVRLELGRPALAQRKPEWRFCWVHRFPLFEKTETGWTPMHHMFTHPLESDIPYLESDPGRVRAELYDLVLNGNELGSGSVRIHRPELQERVMAVIGLTREQAYEKFGFLLDAFRFGAPPHGGIAIGLDRVVMLVVGADSLRDTIAFPKTASATSLMDGAPAEVDDESLRELHLKLDL
jgi:aspartyl-tRNA synthetase